MLCSPIILFLFVVLFSYYSFFVFHLFLPPVSSVFDSLFLNETTFTFEKDLYFECDIKERGGWGDGGMKRGVDGRMGEEGDEGMEGWGDEERG